VLTITEGVAVRMDISVILTMSIQVVMAIPIWVIVLTAT
jgi:hypothetical protein